MSGAGALTARRPARPPARVVVEVMDASPLPPFSARTFPPTLKTAGAC